MKRTARRTLELAWRRPLALALRIRARAGLCVLLFCLSLCDGLAEPQPKDESFPDGIGIYAIAGSSSQALAWTTDPADQQRAADNSIILQPDVAFYSYGLDFSAGGMVGPLPPHLLGYSWGCCRPNGKAEGDWAVRFVPVEGLRQKTYRLKFEGPWPSLAKDSGSYRFWYLRVPGANRAYAFRFGDPAAAAAAQARSIASLAERLAAKDVTYAGQLRSSAFGIFDSQSSSFVIRFTAFDAGSGRLAAEVSGVGDRERLQMEGQARGRDVTLRLQGADAVWTLAADGETLKGSAQGALFTGTVDISLRPIQPALGRGAANPAPQDFPGERFPQTRTRALAPEDIKGWSKVTLRYAINEIFARRGMHFAEDAVRRQFERFPWYRPDRNLTAAQIEAGLTEIEAANLKLLGDARSRP